MVEAILRGLVGIGLLCQGIGNGVARPSLGATLANAVDEADLGIASASQRMARLVGNSIGIALLTAVYGGVETTSAFGRAYLAALGLGLLALVATARIVDRRAVATPTAASATAPSAIGG